MSLDVSQAAPVSDMTVAGRSIPSRGGSFLFATTLGPFPVFTQTALSAAFCHWARTAMSVELLFYVPMIHRDQGLG